ILRLGHRRRGAIHLAYVPTDYELVQDDRTVVLERQSYLQKVRTPHLITTRPAAAPLASQHDVLHKFRDDPQLGRACLPLNDRAQKFVVQWSYGSACNRTG